MEKDPEVFLVSVFVWQRQAGNSSGLARRAFVWSAPLIQSTGRARKRAVARGTARPGRVRGRDHGVRRVCHAVPAERRGQAPPLRSRRATRRQPMRVPRAAPRSPADSRRPDRRAQSARRPLVEQPLPARRRRGVRRRGCQSGEERDTGPLDCNGARASARRKLGCRRGVGLALRGDGSAGSGRRPGHLAGG